MTRFKRLNCVASTGAVVIVAGLMLIQMGHRQPNAERAGLAADAKVDCLLYGILQHDVSQVQRALEDGVDPNARDMFGQTPLFHVAHWQHPEAAKLAQLLIDRGADVNATSPSHTALINAITCDNYEVAEVLLQNGAKANLPGTPSALQHAINVEVSPKLVQLLMDEDSESAELAMQAP